MWASTRTIYLRCLPKTQKQSFKFKLPNQWANCRGAVIRMQKTELLHICKKRTCNNNICNIRNMEIRVTDRIRILCLFFERNLTKLYEINNLLKLICCRRNGLHIDMGLNICRALTKGKILHGITIYGWTSKNNIIWVNTSIDTT